MQGGGVRRDWRWEQLWSKLKVGASFASPVFSGCNSGQVVSPCPAWDCVPVSHFTRSGPESCDQSAKWDVVSRFLSTWMLCYGFFFFLFFSFFFFSCYGKSWKVESFPTLGAVSDEEPLAEVGAERSMRLAVAWSCAGTMWLRCTLEEEAAEVNAKALCQTLATREVAIWRKITFSGSWAFW